MEGWWGTTGWLANQHWQRRRHATVTHTKTHTDTQHASRPPHQEDKTWRSDMDTFTGLRRSVCPKEKADERVQCLQTLSLVSSTSSLSEKTSDFPKLQCRSLTTLSGSAESSCAG